MNNFELEQKLKSVRVPERPDDYWEDFPARIRVQLRRAPVPAEPRRVWQPRLAWAGGFALAVALLLVEIEVQPIHAFSLAINKQKQNFHAQLARMDSGLHKLILNTGGMGYLLAEAN